MIIDESIKNQILGDDVISVLKLDELNSENTNIHDNPPIIWKKKSTGDFLISNLICDINVTIPNDKPAHEELSERLLHPKDNGHYQMGIYQMLISEYLKIISPEDLLSLIADVSSDWYVKGRQDKSNDFKDFIDSI